MNFPFYLMKREFNIEYSWQTKVLVMCKTEPINENQVLMRVYLESDG